MIHLSCTASTASQVVEKTAFVLSAPVAGADGEFVCAVLINRVQHKIVGIDPLDSLGNAITFLQSYASARFSESASLDWRCADTDMP